MDYGELVVRKTIVAFQSVPFTNIKYLILSIACVLLSFQFYTLNLVTKEIISHREIKEVPYIKNKVKGIQITQAIIQIETGGKPMKGKSGEKGVAQFLPSTWRAYTQKYLGTTTLPMTPDNEFEVLTLHNTALLNKGYTPYELFLIHNQGHKGKCSKGINKYGVAYNSCDYAQKGLAMLK